jgi:hypothetical protein
VAEFAGIWRDMPKIVFSRTLQRADWNTTIRRDVVVEEIMALNVHPVLVGRGKPLFEATDTMTDLQLVGTRTFGNGVVLLRYQRGDATG